MSTVVLLAMHGMPPKDFPEDEKKDFFRLRTRLGEGPFEGEITPDQQRLLDLDKKMRQWPRTKENDAFFFAAQDLLRALENELNLKVVLGFNEFCAPDMDQSLEAAASIEGVKKVIVVTPMVTRGGSHSEEEIPEIVEQARKKFPAIEFTYAWPYQDAAIASFLAAHINSFITAEEHEL